MDRGKIIFDTIVPSNIYDSVRSTNINENNGAKLGGYQNLVAIITNKFLMLYDLRTHSLISIDGVFKFKNIPSIGGNLEGINSSTVFYDLRLGKEQLALMSLSTNKPLRLPNGSYWFNIVRGSGTHNYWNDGIGRSNLQVRYHGGAKGSILEMIYDRSSGERYFYNVDERRYLSDDEIPKVNNGILKLHSGYNMPNTITFKLDRNGSLENEAWNAPLVIVKDGKFINIDGNTEFKYVQYLGDGLLNYTTEMEGYRFVNFKIYDFNTNSHVVLPNGRLNIHTVEDSSDSNSPVNSRLLFIKYKDTLDAETYLNKSLFIYDKKQKSFLKNPVGYPSNDSFVVERNGFKDGSGVIIALVPNPRPWWTYYQTRDQDDSWKEDYGTLYIPGANTTDVYKDDSQSYNSRFTNIKIVGGPDRRDNVENNDNFSDVEMQQMVREVVDRILKQK
jgi:hypothetical protein